MANIKPVSDLRNYQTVLNDCSSGAPVYLTKNGRGKYVVVDIGEYEKLQAEVALFNELAKAERNENWMTLAETKQRLGL